MSIIAGHLTLSAGASGGVTLELGRAWLKRVIVFPQANISFRISNQGITVLPVFARGGDLTIIPVDTLDFEINKEIGGPPYELLVEGTNSAGTEQTLRFVLDGYASPYPRVRVKEPEGFSAEEDNGKNASPLQSKNV